MRSAFLVALLLFPQDEGWVPLFNGKDLSGWVSVNCTPSTFTARDGMIVCTGVPTGVMRTEKQYENFILELEWRHVTEGGNAGLFVHSDALPVCGQPFTRSIEIQIMLGDHPEGLYTRHGDVFSIQGAKMVPDRPHPKGWERCLPSEKRVKGAGEWNHYRVESRDGSIKLSVNGKEVSGGTKCNPRKGYICLESEGSEVHFRNLKIKELPGSNPAASEVAATDEGFRAITEWKPGEGHWTAKDWVLDYDGKGKDLWTEKEYGDFVLIADWRLPGKPVEKEFPSVNEDGTDGPKIKVQDCGDSGIFLRGNSKSQVNIWCWPIGSGEVYGYRTDAKMTAEVRRGVTPKVCADNPPGQWNRFVITMKGDRLTVVLNGKTVLENAHLPGVPEKGPIALQHHGDPLQFANIYIKELKGDYRDAVLADKPIAYYEFNGDARDSAGTHHGAAKGGVTFGQTGPVGKAILLDGRDGRIRIPGHGDFKSIGEGAFTIELWFNTSSAERGDLFNYKGEEGHNDLGIFSCLEGEGQVSEYEAQDHRVASDGFAISEWHHVVVTRAADLSMVLYVDGESRDTGTGEMSWDFDADLLIGCNHQEGDADAVSIPFSGLVDEVAIYKKALSADRVRAHYAAAGGKGGKSKPKEASKPLIEIPKVDDTGFTTLDLSSFRFKLENKDADPAKTFLVTDDAIVCTGSPAGYMQTRQSFSNFTLRFEWRFKRPANLKDDSKFGGNSGYLVFITEPNALGIWPKSIEVQGMHRDAGHILPIPRGVKCKVEHYEQDRKRAINPVGEWNFMEITARSGNITVSINGIKVSSVTECELKEGPIGFQSEGAEIHWRKIRIKEDK